MVNFQRHRLSNGLTLLIHSDFSTPLVSTCMTYKVGTRNENPKRTGFAHLFEHLMFGGSTHAPHYDAMVQQAGGENNAFTNQDMTVYYNIVPKANLEMILWLEADRMLNLKLNQQALDRQRKVVIEEFKEVCINEPYGDIWHHIGPLAYPEHPYQVPTIGKTIDHIAEADLEDVQFFFEKYYCPNNAILTLSGAVDPQEAIEWVEKWFGDIPKGPTPVPTFPEVFAPNQRQALTVKANAPLDALYLVFYSAARQEQAYYMDDVLSDILAEGETSWLYTQLVKKQSIFSDIDAYITGSLDRGLLVIEGKLDEGIDFETAEAAIWEQLDRIKNQPLHKKGFQKLLNRIEHNIEFGETSNLHKAISLGYYEMLGDANWINQEAEHYQEITAQSLQARANAVFDRERHVVIYYQKKA